MKVEFGAGVLFLALEFEGVAAQARSSSNVHFIARLEFRVVIRIGRATCGVLWPAGVKYRGVFGSMQVESLTS